MVSNYPTSGTISVSLLANTSDVCYHHEDGVCGNDKKIWAWEQKCDDWYWKGYSTELPLQWQCHMSLAGALQPIYANCASHLQFIKDKETHQKPAQLSVCSILLRILTNLFARSSKTWECFPRSLLINNLMESLQAHICAWCNICVHKRDRHLWQHGNDQDAKSSGAK